MKKIPNKKSSNESGAQTGQKVSCSIKCVIIIINPLARERLREFFTRGDREKVQRPLSMEDREDI